MRIKIALIYTGCAAALVLATGMGIATSADDASIKRGRDGGSVPDVVVLYEDGSGRLDNGQGFCIAELKWGCELD